MRRFDTAWLRYRPSGAERRAFRRDALARGVPRTDPAAPSLRGGCTVLLIVPFALLMVLFTIAGFSIDGVSGTTIGLTIVTLFMLLGTVLIVGRVRFPRSGRRLWRERLILARFAQANGSTYTPVADTRPDAPGLLLGMSDRIYDVIATGSAPQIVIGNLAYKQETSRGGAIDHRWGFISVQLERSFPHTILDSTTNNGLSGQAFPNPYVSGAIQLEGDFPKHFKLLCPVGYNADVRYLLTPDLMVDLIDSGSAFDVEIVDDRIIFYKPLGLALANEREWMVINRLLQRVAADMARRAGRYSDDRTLDGSVAPQGVRMQRVNLLPWLIGTFVVLAVGWIIGLVVQLT
ncbi:hypothetical protein [Microbacterium sp. MPKO10]|uniref:hypothetical protein n=1 Tax=Microbacterium sp. MPKO10 TaxID=2989818 RepID=UPI00223691EC|nr:hypothetical protein [Microbacterium sp. MPKO10]MCW4457185.1 hypothetical protein [Microbacterium sp. MPKO10]